MLALNAAAEAPTGPPGPTSTGRFRYWAFISYSHRDTAVAKALQNAIEGYPVPRSLVGRATPVGELPKFLRPVFRDRDELPAGADLDSTVRDAVAASRYLIVVCSPAAARSEWVEREVLEFKRVHGEGRVLALITSGQPFASRLAGREAEECLPAAVRFALSPDGLPNGRPIDVVAADLRPDGDGRRLATLKILAGMMGGSISVDQLARRDAQRRARRMALIAAAAVVASTVMGVLTVVAFRERAEAQRQHAQAEDMLGFMLGDLRKKLEPIGHLDVLDAVGAQAIAYYAKQDAARLDDDALGRRSRALHLIGEIREQRGRLDEALGAFRSAEVTTGQALARSPRDGQRIFDHAQSVYWVGYIAYRRGEADAAQAAFLKYRELAQQLVQIDPANADWRLETAYAGQTLGVFQLDRERPHEALASFVEARDAYARLRATRPELGNELADADGWIAEAHQALGDYAAAIRAQQTRLEVLLSVPDAANDTRARHNTANAHFALGQLHLLLGDGAAAELDARSSADMAVALAATDRSNLDWLSEACFNRLRLAEVEVSLGHLSSARQILDGVAGDAARLVASDASMMRWRVGVTGLMLAVNAQMPGGGSSLARAADIDDFLGGVAKLVGAGKKLTTHEAEIVATLELLSGDLHEQHRQHPVAVERWESAAARLQPISASGELSVLTLLARLRLRLGDATTARALAARVAASKFRHPAYATLVRELSNRPPARAAQAPSPGEDRAL